MYANSVIRRWLPVAAVVVLTGWTGLSLAQERKPEPAKPRDVVDAAQNVGELKTFCRLLESAGLSDTLKGKGPYTVFAPTDEAFAKLGKQLDELQKPENRARLQRILKNHVLESRKTSVDVKAMKAVVTWAGEELKVSVSNNVVMLNDAKLGKADTEAGNGLIHIVDTVLIPEEQP